MDDKQINRQARALMSKCYFGLELEGSFNLNQPVLNDYCYKYHISDYHTGRFKIINPYNNKNKTIKLKIERDGSLNTQPEPARVKRERTNALNRARTSFEEIIYNKNFSACEVIFSKYIYKNFKNRLNLFLRAINNNKNRLSECYFNTTTGAHIHISLNSKILKGNLRNAITNKTGKTFTELKDTINVRQIIKDRIYRNYARFTNDVEQMRADRYSYIAFNNRYNTIELRYINITNVTTIKELMTAIDEQLLLFFKTLILQARDTQQQDAINLDIDQEPIINNVNYTY
jgi:hypothetical protein